MLLRFLLAGLAIIMVAAGGTATASLLVLDDEVDDIIGGVEPIDDFTPDDVQAGDPQTLLLLGSDRRKGDKAKGIPQRSDTILLARLDPDRDTAAVMSIPRDLIVDIPGRGRRRINEAYGADGANGASEAIKRLLSQPGQPFAINHVIDIGFRGFREVVNELNCIYTDVDRRYFNDNNPPVGSDEKYSAIDLQPGYQRLCGEDALSFVRFRHLDSDFVRGARQQAFLRQAKEQVGSKRLFDDRKELFGLLAENASSNLADASTAEVLKLIKVTLEASKNPAREITFPATDTKDGALEISDAAVRRTLKTFMAAGGSQVKTNTGSGEGSKKQPASRARKGDAPAAGLVQAVDEGEDHVLNLATELRALPIYFPGVRIGGEGGYVTATAAPNEQLPRGYVIRDRADKPHSAYRVVLAYGETGQYYGVQGTTWTRPPILDDPTDFVSVGGKTFARYFDGSKIRLMAWRPKDGGRVYWISNTLSNRLGNAQMMDIARSLRKIG